MSALTLTNAEISIEVEFQASTGSWFALALRASDGWGGESHRGAIEPYYGYALRWQGLHSNPSASLRVYDSGLSTELLAPTWSVDSARAGYRIRLQVEGSAFRVKQWLSVDEEPATWQTAVDETWGAPGEVRWGGARATTAQWTTSNAPRIYRVEIIDLDTAQTVLVDDFDGLVDTPPDPDKWSVETLHAVISHRGDGTARIVTGPDPDYYGFARLTAQGEALPATYYYPHYIYGPTNPA